MHGSPKTVGYRQKGNDEEDSKERVRPYDWALQGWYVHGLCLQLLLGLLFALGMVLGAPEVCNQVTSSQSVRGLLPCTAQQQQQQQQLPALPPTPQQQPPLNNHMISQVSQHSVLEPPHPNSDSSKLWKYSLSLVLWVAGKICFWRHASPSPTSCLLVVGERSRGRGLAKGLLVESAWEAFSFFSPQLYISFSSFWELSAGSFTLSHISAVFCLLLHPV